MRCRTRDTLGESRTLVLFAQAVQLFDEAAVRRRWTDRGRLNVVKYASANRLPKQRDEALFLFFWGQTNIAAGIWTILGNST